MFSSHVALDKTLSKADKMPTHFYRRAPAHFERLLAIVVLTLLGLNMVQNVAAQTGSWVGKTILVKKNLIKIGHTDGEGRQAYVGVLDGIEYKVFGDQGGWLMVKDRRGAQGWFDKDDAVLLDDAVAHFTERIRNDPANSSAYNYRACAWKLKGELDIAVSDFSEAIRLNPTGTAAFNNRGNAWLDKKEYDKAIADYNEAIRLDPKYALAHHNRGIAWVGTTDYDKAIDGYTEAIRLDPKYVSAYNGRGIAWLNKKDYDKAIADYTEAIRLDPKFAFAFRNRGIAWSNKRDYEKAIRDFSQAIKADPEYAFAYNSLAWLLATCPDEKFRDGSLAIEIAQQCCELTKWKNAYCVSTLAAAYAEAGQFDQATRYQEMALADSGYVQLQGPAARQRLQLFRQQTAYREQ